MWGQVINEYPFKKYFDWIGIANKLPYHNQQHLIDMYNFLEERNVLYSKELDIAILFHDIIYDKDPNKEFRSAEYFIEATKFNDDKMGLTDYQITLIYSLIMSTKDHKLVSTIPAEQFDLFKYIILADLHALANPTSVIKNYVKIMEESCVLYNITEKEFASANLEFMLKLLETVRNNIPYDEYYRKIKNGILKTIELSVYILDEEGVIS